jgi:hypothetical protein
MKKLWILGTLALAPTLLHPIAAHADRFQERTSHNIKQHIDDDQVLNRFKIKTQTVRGAIHLRGTVARVAQSRRAGNIARHYSAGFPIVNLIVINPALERR